ncbi:hypothetical protein FJZ33_01840 [Candidatus Poribacteria bacterium]|nr:hypothetical protein [Candidatus Poribacteria bacterium]
MVELYVENLKKSITELEIDKELSKHVIHHLGRILQVFSTILGPKQGLKKTSKELAGKIELRLLFLNRS